MNRKNALFVALLVGVPLLAILSVYVTLTHNLANIPSLEEMYIWTTLSFVSTFIYIRSAIKDGGGTSLGDIVDLAAIITVGPYPVLIANILVVLVRRVLGSAGQSVRDIYNVAQWTLACLAAHYVFQFIIQGSPLTFTARVVGGGMLAWLAYSSTSTGLVAIVISISEKMPLFSTWKANSAMAMVVAMGLAPIAIIMAILYIDYNVVPVIFLTGTLMLINTLVGYWIQRVRLVAMYQREHQLAEVGKAASAILHEISKPLNRIVMLSDFALKGGRSQEEALRQVLKEAHAAARISDKLLTSMSLNVARSEVFPEDLLEELRQAADAEGIPVAITDSREQRRESTLWDADLVRTALLNLVRNAWESQDGRGEPPELALSRIDSSGAARSGPRSAEPVFYYVVTDTGPGISPGMEQDIFEALYSTKRKGLGMGLFIAHQVALAHGGLLRAHNRATGGAEFVLELPIRRK